MYKTYNTYILTLKKTNPAYCLQKISLNNDGTKNEPKILKLSTAYSLELTWAEKRKNKPVKVLPEKYPESSGKLFKKWGPGNTR